MDNNYLAHYGVLGMKWGVRKSRGASSKTPRRQRTWSDDAREASTIKKKKVNQMSNAELRKVNERVRLEQEYSRLNPNAVKKGIKIVAATAGAMGTVMNLYNNSDKLVNAGKKIVDKMRGK